MVVKKYSEIQENYAIDFLQTLIDDSTNFAENLRLLALNLLREAQCLLWTTRAAGKIIFTVTYGLQVSTHFLDVSRFKS